MEKTIEPQIPSSTPKILDSVEFKESVDAFLETSDQKRLAHVKELLDFWIAGEDSNKMLLFFLLLANYHKDMITLVLYRGDSSGGKSYVVKNILKLFPEEDVYFFDSATAKALKYAGDKLEDKKIIFLKEMDKKERDEFAEYLKAIYEGDVKHLETVKKGEKIEGNTLEHHTTIEHIVKSRGVVTTFSFERIQIDLINRAWVLTPNQSYDQTKRIREYKIKREKRLIEWKLKEKEICQKCYFIGQCIASLDFSYDDVYIPFIGKLEGLFPDKYINIRRDMDKLFFLIKIIAIWNQKNRRCLTIGDTRYLLAEYNDMKIALDVGHELLIDLILHIDKKKRYILDYMPLNEDGAPNEEGAFDFGDLEGRGTKKRYTVTDIYNFLRRELSISRRTTYRKLDDLYDEGYLQKEKTGNQWEYWKVQDYNIVDSLKIEEAKEEIDSIVEQNYIYYKNKKEELL